MLTPIAALTTLAVHLGSMQLTAAAEPEAPAVPKGAVSEDPASKGTTEIDGQGKFAAADDVDARHAEDATELELSAGGLLSTGNAFAAAATAQGRFRLRRGIHQLASQAAANYGRADVDVTDPLSAVTTTERETTVSNVQGMVRYDVFFARRWSAFLMTTARRDRFQGLDLRLNVDPGVAFYAVAQTRQRLWFELGYDFQYDRRREEFLFEDRLVDPEQDLDADGRPDTERVRVADDTQVNHAARVFAGYNNSLSDRVTFDTGIEYLQSVVVGRRFRVNWINALTVQLANRFGLGVTYTLRYENQPLPGVAKLDTITAVLLTLRFI